jgi:DNA repair protein RecO (recombination protein O)
LTLFARGANGPKSTLRAVLRPFQRLLVSWSGRSEACQLLTAELDGAATTLPPERLMSGFYLNELLLKLTVRADPHPQIFAAYAEAITALGAGDTTPSARPAGAAGDSAAGDSAAGDEESALRRFEKRLLDDLGYGLELTQTADGSPVQTDSYYRFKPQSGPQLCVAETPGAVYGRSLADLDAENFADSRSLRDAKRVLRVAIDACLEGKSLKSREVMIALHRKEPA